MTDREAQTEAPMVGRVNEEGDRVLPVKQLDGRKIRSLNSLIQAWEELEPHLTAARLDDWENARRLDQVEILAPLRGRDVLCVGKNYKDHAALVGRVFTRRQR